MKKQLLKSSLIAALGVGLLAGSSWATPVNTSEANGESSLETIFTNQGWAIDANSDQITTDAYWQVSENTTSGGWATMLIEIAGNSAVNTFGIYDQDGNIQQLMGGSATTYSKVAITWNEYTGLMSYQYLDEYGNWGIQGSGITMNQTFGFYIGVPSDPYYFYSDSDMNNGDEDQMVTYAGTGTNGLSVNHYVIAFEDTAYSNSDKDFNDMVLLVESINPIPEPTTMLLFGAGLLSLAGIARRKQR